jgi:drug/metabolite transporter (DMT)-like permease
MNRILSGTLLTLASAAGYAFFPIFAKLALRDGVAVSDMLAWRFILAAAIVWLVAPLWWRHARLGSLTRRDILTLSGIGALFAFCALVAFLALARVNATAYTMLFYTYPPMVALISFALGERLPAISWVAIGMALVGCIMAAGKDVVIDNLWGVSLPLINAAAIAVYTILISRYTRHIPGLTSGFMVITVSCVIFTAGSIFYGLRTPPSMAGWLDMLGISAVSTIVGIVALVIGITIIGPSRSAIISTIGPPITVILASALLGEEAEPLQYVGGALILVSILLLQWRGRVQPVSMGPEVVAVAEK